MDIAAPRSVVGTKQLNFILNHIGRKTIPRIHTQRLFRFGDFTACSLGLIEVALQTPAPRHPIRILLDIVSVDIPALLGLDVLDAEYLYADNAANLLVHRRVTSKEGMPLQYLDLWSVTLSRFDNHLYAQMNFPSSTFYTEQQLHRLERQFAHPSVDKLYNLLKSAGIKAVNTSTREILKDIAARCESFQRNCNAPRRFRVKLGQEDVRFNAEAYLDIMYLDGRPFLRIVNFGTLFSAARFLTKVNTESIWEAIIMCWSSVYSSLPHCVRVDEGSQSRKIFAELSVIHQVQVKKSGVQSHHGLGVGEIYHKPLRDTYLKVKLDYGKVQRQVLLALAVKAMNDTLGPEGMIPSALVSGEFSSLRPFQGLRDSSSVTSRAGLGNSRRSSLNGEILSPV